MLAGRRGYLSSFYLIHSRSILTIYMAMDRLRNTWFHGTVVLKVACIVCIWVQLNFGFIRASLTIEMPSGSFCELDAIEECKENECIRHDPYVQKNSPSIFTLYAKGRVDDLKT